MSLAKLFAQSTLGFEAVRSRHRRGAQIHVQHTSAHLPPIISSPSKGFEQKTIHTHFLLCICTLFTLTFHTCLATQTKYHQPAVTKRPDSLQRLWSTSWTVCYSVRKQMAHSTLSNVSHHLCVRVCVSRHSCAPSPSLAVCWAWWMAQCCS